MAPRWPLRRSATRRPQPLSRQRDVGLGADAATRLRVSFLLVMLMSYLLVVPLALWRRAAHAGARGLGSSSSLTAVTVLLGPRAARPRLISYPEGRLPT